MDQSLELSTNHRITPCNVSFNPYFSGSVTGTCGVLFYAIIGGGFNPYFSGSVTGTVNCPNEIKIYTEFQSLF